MASTRSTHARRRGFPLGSRADLVRRCAIAIPCLTAVLGSAGCIKPLFPPDTPRNQFETYDRMRSKYVPLEEPDVFGTPQPALRARLGQQK